MASSVCDCVVFPAHTTSSCSPPPCRTSRPSRCEPSVHHPPGGAHHLPEIRCRSVELAATQEDQNQQPVHSAASKLPKQHNAKRRTYFFNAIDPERNMSVTTPLGRRSIRRPYERRKSLISCTRRLHAGSPCSGMWLRPSSATKRD